MVKVVAFDARGTVVALARQPAELLATPPGHVECDMEALWRLVCRGLRQVCDTLASMGRRIVAMGVSGTMGGVWLIDGRGRPVRHAILWNDGRAVKYLQAWRQDGTLGQLFDLSCNALAPGFMLPVLRWLADHEPDRLASAARLLFCKDWLRYRLTGEIHTEESDASHAPGDVHARGFSERAMELCGVSHLARLVPGVIGSGQIAGQVTPAAAQATGLPVSLPVAAGLADVSATLLGAGAVQTRTATAIVGTSLLNCVTAAQPVFEPRNVGVSFLLPAGRHARALPNQTGTLALEWAARELMPVGADGRPPTPAQLDALAEGVAPGARGVLFHPYLNSTGVLAPVYEPRARGRFWGLGIEHTRADLLRAVYEGVTLAMADCFAHLPAFEGPVRLVGGAANSRLWRQLFADATGVPMAMMAVREAGALGVAMLAGVAVGMWPDLPAAVAACCRIEQIIEPDSQRRALYHRSLRLYQRLRDRLSEECDLLEERVP